MSKTKVELNTILKLFEIFTNKKWIEIAGYEECLSRTVFSTFLNYYSQIYQ